MQTKLNTICAAAAITSGGLAVNAGLAEGGALITGEVSPFAAGFHIVALVNGIGSGGFAIYAGVACYAASEYGNQ